MKMFKKSEKTNIQIFVKKCLDCILDNQKKKTI